MANFSCNESNNSPVWGTTDILAWKILPASLGGGIPYIQKFKDAWVLHNRHHVNANAGKYAMPAELLAGVCWIEVGGDPNFIDRVAYEVRAFDWSGPQWIDKHLTFTNPPEKTSFGPVSMQLRVAAKTLGVDYEALSESQMRGLALCLQKDIFNIEIVARHLRLLIDHDKLQTNPPHLSEEAVKIVGARYNRGTGLSLAEIKKNTSYGNFIVQFWPRFSNLIK